MNLKKIKEDLTITEGLKTITEAYTEIASMQLKMIRREVEDNRTFFADLTAIYALVRLLAKEKIPGYRLPGNGKTMMILITSNFRFYGRISNAASKFFVQVCNQTPCDKVVIGKLGVEYLNAIRFQNFQSFIFKKDLPEPEELNRLLAKVKDYSRILVIYCQFKTVLTQVPTVQDITQTQSLALEAASLKKLTSSFILEPEIKKMIEFFDSTAKNILLENSFLEAQLGMLASRLIAMEEAQSNAKKLLLDQQVLFNMAKRSLMNKRILETWITQAYNRYG